MIRTALMRRRTDQVPSSSSSRTMDAPSTMAFILPNATSLGRYFIPQSVHTMMPVGRMLRKMGRHPYRPGHIHMIVSAPGHLPATTHLFVAGSEYLDSDAVFGMKESLVAQFDRHPPGIVPSGERIDTPFYTVNYDFRLRPTTAAVERNV